MRKVEWVVQLVRGGNKARDIFTLRSRKAARREVCIYTSHFESWGYKYRLIRRETETIVKEEVVG